MSIPVNFAKTAFYEVRLIRILGSSHSPGPLRQGFLCRASEGRSPMYIKLRDRSQLHCFKRQMISQRQQAAHNATQDHIRLWTEPYLDSQRQDDERTTAP